MLRLLGILFTVLLAIATAVVVWPQFFRLEQTYPFAQLVAARGLVLAGFLAVAVLALLLLLARPLRGFAASVLISWGDPVTRRAPRFDVRRQTPEAAREQFGYNNDFVGVLPHPHRHDRAVLVTNHEYTDETLMFPTGAYDSATIKRIALASHGMSVVELVRGRGGRWSARPAFLHASMLLCM